MTRKLLPLLLLALSAPAWGQTLIASGCWDIGHTGATTSATPINTTGANFIFISVNRYASSSVISDNWGNVYTRLTSYGGSLTEFSQYTATTPTVGTGTYFIDTGGSTYDTICAEAWSGIVQPSPFDSGGTATDSGGQIYGCPTCNALAGGTVTPTSGPRLWITATDDYAGSPVTYTIDSSFTEDSYFTGNGNSYGTAIAHLVQSTSAPISSLHWTESISTATWAVIEVFKVSGGAATVTMTPIIM